MPAAASQLFSVMCGHPVDAEPRYEPRAGLVGRGPQRSISRSITARRPLLECSDTRLLRPSFTDTE